MHNAAENGHTETVRVLLSDGRIDVNIQDNVSACMMIICREQIVLMYVCMNSGEGLHCNMLLGMYMQR